MGLLDWSRDGKDSLPPVVKAVAVVVGAFLITGIIYFTAQQGLSLASRRVQSKYAPRYGDDPQPIPPTFAPQSGVSSSGYAPLNAPGRFSGVAAAPNRARTGGVMQFGANATAPALTAPPLTLARDPFTSNADRQQARQQLREVRGTLATLKQYDARGLWTQVSLLNQARQAEAASAGMGGNGPQSVTLLPDGGGGGFRDGDEAAQVRRSVTRKLQGELEAMNAEVALSTHPERFPEPLHNGAEAVGAALRTYLETARMAVAHPDQSSNLKNRSMKELARAEELIREMEGPLGGGASAAN